MGKRQLVNQAEFARAVGKSVHAIYQLVKRGKIKVQLKNGKKVIDLEAGKKQLAAELDQRASKKAQKRKIKEAIDKDKGVYQAPPKFDDQGEMTQAEADRREKVQKALLAELKVKQTAGELIEIDKVRRIAFEKGRKVRDAVMTVPGKVAHELAVVTDPHELELKLSKALTQALEAAMGGSEFD